MIEIKTKLTEKIEKRGKKPKCPSCNSTKVIHNKVGFKCKNCGYVNIR